MAHSVKKWLFSKALGQRWRYWSKIKIRRKQRLARRVSSIVLKPGWAVDKVVMTHRIRHHNQMYSGKPKKRHLMKDWFNKMMMTARIILKPSKGASRKSNNLWSIIKTGQGHLLRKKQRTKKMLQLLLQRRRRRSRIVILVWPGNSKIIIPKKWLSRWLLQLQISSQISLTLQ